MGYHSVATATAAYTMACAGLAGYDAHNWLQCHFDKEHEACAKPAYTKQLDSVFTMTEPLVARSDIVLAALKENFAGSADLVQVPCLPCPGLH